VQVCIPPWGALRAEEGQPGLPQCPVVTGSLERARRGDTGAWCPSNPTAGQQTIRQVHLLQELPLSRFANATNCRFILQCVFKGRPCTSAAARSRSLSTPGPGSSLGVTATQPSAFPLLRLFDVPFIFCHQL
jgi:hypothetical protein